jgi:hypothetical protein
MDRYLVEVHVPHGLETAQARSDALARLEEHTDVLADPPPLVPEPDAEEHTVAQFSIEAEDQATADTKGRKIAGLLGGEATGDAGDLEVSLSSARRLDDR